MLRMQKLDDMLLFVLEHHSTANGTDSLVQLATTFGRHLAECLNDFQRFSKVNLRECGDSQGKLATMH